MIKVSVIVPNFNHKAFLPQRLDSIFNQNFNEFEVILLDDASTDGSQELLMQYKNHPKVSHLIINEVNSGSPFHQWKKGVHLAKGEYIWIAESDDYCDITFLERIIQKTTPTVGVYYTQSADVTSEGKLISNRNVFTEDFSPNIWEGDFTMEGREFIKEYLIVKNVIPNASAVVFRRELFDPSIFDDSFLNMHMCGDWFAWIHLCEKTKITFISDTLNSFRDHESISRHHLSLEKKKNRLREESVIRRAILNLLGISNTTLNHELYRKWYQLHKARAIVSADFYSVIIRPKSRLSFILDFLISKTK